MPVVIENPVLNSPYDEPARHFLFGADGITDQVIDARRISTYFVPIPPPKKRGGQLTLGSDWTAERIQENAFINRVRERVAIWRQGGCLGVTGVTRELLDYWRDPQRERRLFFCQIEALETAIYLSEVAPRHGDGWIENALRDANEGANPGLYRVAFKMATGAGKTLVMAMLIAWQALNKIANSRDARFSDAFLVITPGITIRERLRVLLPNDPGSYYREHDLVSPEQLERLQAARVVITNFHAFLRRDEVDAAALTKKILVGRGGNTDALKESPQQVANRVCRGLGTKRSIVVINDEAHHCYRLKPESDEDTLDVDDRAEARRNAEAARVWISGLEDVKAKIGAKVVYDLSATPFFLAGSGYREGTLFPWVVSDFSLIDAIESGIVKVPRVPVSDNQVTGLQPTYRDLWLRIRKGLPKKGRAAEAATDVPLPVELDGALRSLYGNYEKSHRRWEAAGIGTPPVFIVVCNNTNVSKLVFDWISGSERQLPGGETVVSPGNLPIFSNEENGRWRDRPNSLLIDSAQLESGDAMEDAFKKIAAAEIAEFKAEFRLRTGRDPGELTDEDLLREVMNTVGKQGKLGERVKCVVSVSMLTEGWDANTVTHVLGVRAFGTQLLCEQVVGRGLRRISYEPNADGRFEPEYAEVYGVPFSFIPTAGTDPDPRPPKAVHRVKAMEDRAALEITFPRVIGYRYALPVDRLRAEFNEDSRMTLSTADLPTRVELDPIVGESAVHDLAELAARREQEVAFRIAKLALDKHFRDDEGNERPWLFPQLFAITTAWLNECVACKDGTFKQLLVLAQWSHDAADRIQRSIVRGTAGEKRVLPILQSFDREGRSGLVDFNTTKPVYATDARRCHLNYVVLDSNWEAKLIDTLESMGEVVCYVKNQGLGFAIPYTFEGKQASYLPDLIVHIDDGRLGPVNLVIEVTGEKRKEKAAKVAAATTLWVPAINNNGEFGRWAFLEVADPYTAESLIREALRSLAQEVAA
ncbi:MAG: DEAD/DEAH box helicase family protein [Chloroflexota bacterium]|nr:DEAD/DEAH box helicase family protein [Chloroflexota bacterium]